jgi:pimeloyl-ACP methyl ester carboxylesterase
MKLTQWFGWSEKQVGRLIACLFVLFIGIMVGLYFLLRPVPKSLASHPAPVTTYEEAVARFERLRLSEEAATTPLTRSILYTHRHRVEKAVVFFHGYSSSPRQFRDLGERFFQLGYNVLIPRLPRHGIADRKLENLSTLRAEELRDCADTSVDIAAGLGEKVYVGGLSAGGVMAAWIAQNRKEVSRALLIAPSLVLGRRAGTLGGRFGVFFIACVPDIPTDFFSVNSAAEYAYPGFSAKALGQLLRMSLATFGDAFKKPPAVQDVILVTSESDHTVSNFATWQLIGLWHGKGLQKFVNFDFPHEMRAPM